MNILFVCKGNRFRSKVAEAVFNKLNRSRHHKAKSAGIIKGRPVADIVKICANELGYTIKGPPRTIDIPLLKWQDMIVIVADNVPSSLFDDIVIDRRRINTRVWKIPDTEVADKEVIMNIMKKIEKNVIKLLNDLHD